MEWTKIASSRSELMFGENHISLIELNGQKICIIQTPEALRACADRCPHAGASLANGVLDRRGNIECAVHHYKFNLTHGRDTQNEGYKLKVFDIKETEEGIFLKVKNA